MNDLDKKWIKTFLGKKEIAPRCLNDYNIFHKDQKARVFRLPQIMCN